MFGARPAAGGGFAGGGGGFAGEGAGGSSFAEPSFDDAYDAELSMLRGGLGGGKSPEAQAASRCPAQAAHAAKEYATGEKGEEAGNDARTQELVGVIRRLDLLERKRLIGADLAAKLRKGALGDDLQQALVMLHHCYPESSPEGDAILGQYG